MTAPLLHTDTPLAKGLYKLFVALEERLNLKSHSMFTWLAAWLFTCTPPAGSRPTLMPSLQAAYCCLTIYWWMWCCKVARPK